mmetsp:Transcript_64485/g.199954  ORF Transcript_64485/g.199954 Transcript_64485/m.199954 type:complete len:235 (+) Transcript_64485:901-1605(+)
MARLSTLKSSSVLSSLDSQYAFFSSSSVCSFASKASMSSIMPRIFSKLTFCPWRANASRSRRASFVALLLRTAPKACKAFLLRCLSVSTVCNREALGKVFLKSSKASSSFSILMVSANATSSSARVFFTASHSFSLVVQLFSRFARKPWSSARDLEVSSKSSFNVAISTPNSAMRWVLSSIAFKLAAISFSFAADNAANAALAASSSFVMSARLLSIVPFICFRMPVIEVLCGA